MKKSELIVALDRASAAEVEALLAGLPAKVGWYKVGLELYAAAGPAALAPLKKRQKKIFLDLKLHDIPNTVARAVRAAAAHDISLLTVHALGGEAMLRAAVAAAKSAGRQAPKIIAVTILTSHDQNDLAALGIRSKVGAAVLNLAGLALRCGVDGLVASCAEAVMLRRRFGHKFLLIVPGIRPPGAGAEDQKRTATPAIAIKAGADFIVVGRPILEAPDPAAAAKAILDEMAKAQKSRSTTEKKRHAASGGPT